MKRNGIVKSIDIYEFVYETDDLDKIMKSIRELLGELYNKAKMSIDKLEGHFGDLITTLHIRLEGGDAERLLNSIIKRVKENKELLLSNERIEDGKYYLRINRQSLIQGKIEISFGGDSLKIVANIGKMNMDKFLYWLKENLR